jgi:hypothetical protein
MSKIKIIRLVAPSDENPGESLQVLPGTFDDSRSAVQAITEDGDYLFLELHSVYAAKKEEDHANENE